MEVEYDKVLVIRKNGKVVAFVYHNLHSGHKTFFSVDEMGMDEIKELMEPAKGIEYPQVKVGGIKVKMAENDATDTD